MTTLEDVRRFRARGLPRARSRSGSRRWSRVTPGTSARPARARSPPAASGCDPCSVFLVARPAAAPVAAGVAVELVHMATLVHDDLIDGATVRRGRAAVWAAHGADAARATGDYLFARAFAELAAAGDLAASPCSPRPRSRSRAARRCSGASSIEPETTVDAYLERCALKTGKLFEAACLLGSGEAARPFRAQPRDRLPDRGRHPRLLGRDDRDRQDRRAPTSARGRRRCRCCSRRRRTRSSAPRSRAARTRVCSCGWPRPARSSARVRSRAATPTRPREPERRPHRDELEALADAVVDRRS